MRFSGLARLLQLPKNMPRRRQDAANERDREVSAHVAGETLTTHYECPPSSGVCATSYSLTGNDETMVKRQTLTYSGIRYGRQRR